MEVVHTSVATHEMLVTFPFTAKETLRHNTGISIPSCHLLLPCCVQAQCVLCVLSSSCYVFIRVVVA